MNEAHGQCDCILVGWRKIKPIGTFEYGVFLTQLTFDFGFIPSHTFWFTRFYFSYELQKEETCSLICFLNSIGMKILKSWWLNFGFIDVFHYLPFFISLEFTWYSMNAMAIFILRKEVWGLFLNLFNWIRRFDHIPPFHRSVSNSIPLNLI